MLFWNIFFVLVLIAATAFFVAAEFAFVKIRPSRIDQLVLEGNRRAKRVHRVTENLDGYLSACQLGITITALGLGWLGEPTFEHLFAPILDKLPLPDQVTATASFLAAFFVITFLHVVLGELAPKTAAIQKAETISLYLAGPMVLFYKIMYPLIWLLNGSAAQFVKLFGFRRVREQEEALSEEELRLILTESYESGKINQSEYGYVSRIFRFDELKAREIMVPRTDMVCLYADRPWAENVQTIREARLTRYPVARESKDQIIGLINTKQLFLESLEGNVRELDRLIRPILSVPSSTPVKMLLHRMQNENVHMAVLLDEYGGTAGLVTIEDILEEIVGDIRDEFDTQEKPEIETIGKDHIRVDGKYSVSEIHDWFGLDLDQTEFDTIGGWLYAQNPMLHEGEDWSFKGLTFTVLKKDRHRIRKVEIRRSGRR